MSHHKFGKFSNVGDFLEHYKTQQSAADSASLAGKPVDQAIAEMKAESLNKPNIAEHVTIKVTEVVEAGPAVKADVEEAVASGQNVFVAIHYGDAMGLPAPIPGIVPGVALHLQGFRITKDQAKAQDGDHMPVLHFTHHPDGFTCTPERCCR